MSSPVLTWLRSWKGGYTTAAACAVIGSLRVATAPLDLLTCALFLLALGYAGAAAAERRRTVPRRASPAPPARAPATPRTRDRIGAVMAIVAGVVGLVLVFQGHEADDDTPAAPPTPGRFDT